MKKSSRIINKYDYKDVARKLGVTYLTVARLCRQGKIKSKIIAGKYYISKRDLNQYLDTGNIFEKPEKVVLEVIKKSIDQSIDKAVRVLIENNFKKIEAKILALEESGKAPKKTTDNLKRRLKTEKLELLKI